jgi:hypothetical protein
MECFSNIWDFFDHLAHCMFNWYIFSGFGVMRQEKSGNPDSFLKIFFQTSPNAQSLQLSPSNPVSAKLALRNSGNTLQWLCLDQNNFNVIIRDL